MPLRDILTPEPRVLFVGINPSLRSEAVGHHFAGPGNPFWRLLYAARLVPVELTHNEGGRLHQALRACSQARRRPPARAPSPS
jgi:TDG/mug DNA glycosylase family protein